MALSELLAATLERARDPKRATDNGDVALTCAEPVLATVEWRSLQARLPRPLPPLLTHLYTEVGNGGYGPGYGLLEALHTVDGTLAFCEMYHLSLEQALTPFVYWGCTVYSVIELATGRVGILDQDAVEDGCSPAEAAWWQYQSVDDFWTAWLNGEELFFPVGDDE